MNCRYFFVVMGCFMLAATSARAAVVTLVPHLSVSEEYSDNRYLSNTNKVEENSTIVSPGFDQSITGRRAGLDLSYTASYVMYHNANATTWRHNASMSFWGDLSRYTKLEVGDSFLRSDSAFQQNSYNLLGYVTVGNQIIPVGEASVRTGRKEYQTNAASADLTHQFGRQDSISLHYLYSLWQELQINNGNDNRRNRPSVSLTYWLTPRYGIDVSAAYTDAQFEHSDSYNDWQGTFSLRRRFTRHFNIFLSYEHTRLRYATENGRSYDEYAPSTGFSYKIEKDISLTLGVGYFYQKIETGPNQEGPFLTGSVNKTWSFPRGSASLVGSAGMDRNDFGTQRLGQERYYALSGTIGYSLTRRLQSSFNTSFRIDNYINSENRPTDYLGGIGCGLTYTPKPWLSISANLSHDLLRSQGNRNYDENRAYLTVSFVPRGYRWL